MKRAVAVFLIIGLFACRPGMAETEVFKESGAKVFIREHPQTGKSFVSIRAETTEATDIFKGFTRREIRPDYRLLDPKNRSGAVPYDGPSNDRTKVYVFAATMVTLGAAGIAVTAALPAGAAATAGTGSSAGLYAAGGTAVALGTAGTVYVNTRVKPGEENYVHTAESHSLEGDPHKVSFREAVAAAEKAGIH
ncbi:MAG TPA: hypothetical protein PLL75_02570 [Candidatus Omnitrophota bacterium]|nr:hypothetical protein [Candidatus Omnitrophota bacterium]HPS36596.1 hypothetical protein [Candidatus Omnitrophota bacterium]